MKVFAAGAYGYGNFGDDCYVDVLRVKLNGIWPGVDLDIMSQFDETTFRPNSYDATLLAGGGLYYQWIGACGSVSLKHYLRYPAIAQWLGKKSHLIGLGVQGKLDPEFVAPYLHAIDGASLRTVRDRYSADVLRSVGVRAPILECADLVYSMPLVPDLNRPERRTSKPVLGVVASQPGREFAHDEFKGFETRFLEALRALEREFEIHFISFDNRCDTSIAGALGGNHRVSKFEIGWPNAIQEFVEDFQKIDVFVTTRYHGGVLSTMAGIPFLAIGAPNEKVDRECRSFGYPQFLSYDSNTEDFIEGIRQTWSERNALRDQLTDAALRKRRLSSRNFEVIAQEFTNAGSFGTAMIPELVRTITSENTLVIWAAPQEHWHEAACLLDHIRNFTSLVPPLFAQTHPQMKERLPLPRPGIFNWAAFPQDLKNRLTGHFENVVVCHTSGSTKAAELKEIAAAAGSRIWEFRLWDHTISSVDAEKHQWTLDRSRTGT